MVHAGSTRRGRRRSRPDTRGRGEGYGPAGPVKAGIEFLAPFILGGDPLECERRWRVMHRRAFDHARQGVLVAALSALDVALWDLKGKLLGQPLSTLLGGRRREAVTAYATGIYFTDGPGLADRLAEEARRHRDVGFGAMKMKVGLSVGEDTAHVAAVREAIGPDVTLMVDANHAYGRREALSRRSWSWTGPATSSARNWPTPAWRRRTDGSGCRRVRASASRSTRLSSTGSPSMAERD